MSERRLRNLVVVVPLLLIVGCAPKMTTQQALVEEAFENCHAQGPSTSLERVDRDGRFAVVGRESESQRVHDCMMRYAAPSRREPAMGAGPSVVGAGTPPGARSEPLAAGRLPGTWRGTLKVPARRAGETETASPATLRFVVAAGTLRWTLAAGAATPTVVADGAAVVVDGELRMTGTIRGAPARTSPEPPRSSVAVRYAGTLVGDRLEVTGVTTDKQVHVLSIRRVAE